jgi:long-chain fatty acid transport protein
MCRRWSSYALGLTTVVVIGAWPATSRGQGFQLNDIGSCAVARGYATTGAPCQDASVIYWNPGAAATLPGFSVYAGGAIIGVRGAFTADTTLTRYAADPPTGVPPHLFVNYATRIGRRRASAGIGVYVPYGLTSQWPLTFPGRFEAFKAHIATVYVQPNVAIEIVHDVLTVGGGPIIGHSSIEFRQSLDLSAVPVPGGLGITFGELGFARGSEFGRVTLSGSGTAVGYTIGGLLRPLPGVQIGARYLSALTFRYDGSTATFTRVPTGLVLAGGNPFGVPGGTPVDSIVAPQFRSGGPLVTQAATSRVVHPLQVEVGVGYTGLRQTTLDVDYAYVGWDSFATLPLTFEGPAAAAGLSRVLLESYDDSWSLRGSVEHIFGDSTRGIAGRAGFGYAKTPAPPATVTPLLPDMNRYNASAGIGVPLGRGFALDVGYLHVFTRGRRGRIVERTGPAQTAQQLNSGFYDLAADVFSASLRLHF